MNKDFKACLIIIILAFIYFALVGFFIEIFEKKKKNYLLKHIFITNNNDIYIFYKIVSIKEIELKVCIENNYQIEIPLETIDIMKKLSETINIKYQYEELYNSKGKLIRNLRIC